MLRPFHIPWGGLFPLLRETIWLVGLAVAALVAAYRRWSSFAWPETEGVVQSIGPVTPPGGTKARHGFTYSYQVDGEYYSGELAVANALAFPRTEEDVRRMYPSGTKFRLKYKPGDPLVSVATPIDVPPKSVYFPPRDDPR